MRDAFWSFLADPERVLKVVAIVVWSVILVVLTALLGWGILCLLVPITLGGLFLYYISFVVPPYYSARWGRLFKYIFRKR